jgi:hypothetical protein
MSNTEDTLYGLSTRLDLDYSRSGQAFLKYNFSQNESNDSSREYTKNTFSSGVSWRF